MHVVAPAHGGESELVDDGGPSRRDGGGNAAKSTENAMVRSDDADELSWSEVLLLTEGADGLRRVGPREG